LPESNLSAESFAGLRTACQEALDEYIRELKKAMELLSLANRSNSDLQLFLAQRERETQAYERYREIRRRYDEVVRRGQKPPPKS
jgi:hypothetical protein